MIEGFDHMVTLFQEKQLFSGVVLLAREGQTLYQRACGPANRMWDAPNHPDTRFATASVTKMFTAAAVVRLIQEGKLRWDTSAVKLLGLEDSAIPGTVTTAHLLTHTSGIADYLTEENPLGLENLWKGIGPSAADSLMKLLPFFMDEGPVQPPGAGFDYNNAGYILLGLMLEKTAGMPFDRVIGELIFKPAGMTHSDFNSLTEVTGDIAEGYIPIRDGDNQLIGWERNIYSVPARGLPDGGACCTAGDLVRFMTALRKGELLDAAHTAALLTPRVAVDKNWQYGYGLWFDVEGGRILRYGHTGEAPGVSARVYHYPPFNLDLVILGNQSYCAGDLDWQLHHLILEEALREADRLEARG